MINLSEETIQSYKDVKPVYKRIYLILRQAVIMGELTLEEKITEEELSGIFGVSRTPIRKAIEQLKKEGFLKNTEKTTLSEKASKRDMACLLEFDSMVESYGAYLAALNGVRQEDLDILIKLNERMRNIDESFRYDSPMEKDLMGIRDIHLQFHMLIAKLSKNKYVYKTVSELRTKMREYSTLDTCLNGHTPHSDYKNIVAPLHDEIICAIRKGNAEDAKAWMYIDISRTKERYLNSYKNLYGFKK